MSDWSDRVAPQAAERLANNAQDGAAFLSRQIQEMVQANRSREALELVNKTAAIERQIGVSPYGGTIGTREFASQGWVYEGVAVNGQQIASIPEHPVPPPAYYGEQPGGYPQSGVGLPEVAAGVAAGIILRGILGNHGRDRDDRYRHNNNYNYYNNRNRWP